MPANKYALLRYRIIDRCLRNSAKPHPSRETLREACEEALYGSGGDAISLSTIDKDIWAMKNEGDLGYYAPIAYSRAHGGYFYEDPEYSISELSLGEDDLQALRFAIATLDQFKAVPLFKQYESSIEKLISRVNISPRPDEEALDRFIQFEKSSVVQGREHLGIILDCIRKKIELNFEYKKFQENESKSYRFHPYLLKEYGNRWYMIGYNPDKSVIATFGLERIEKIDASTQHFKVQPDFNPDVIFKHSIGITENQSKPERVQLSFDRYKGRFLMSQPIHPSQKVSVETENEVVIELDVLLTEELYAFILSHGPSVRVLKPAKLVSEIKNRIKKMSL